MLSQNSPSNVLRPIFSNSLAVKLETLKLDAFIQTFGQGQTLSGKVVQPLPDQKAVVEFEGQKVLVQFPRPVTAGQVINVRVEQTQPQPVLKLIDGPAVSPQGKFPASQNPDSNPLWMDKISLNGPGQEPVSIERAVLRNPGGSPGLVETTSTGNGQKPLPPGLQPSLLTQSDLGKLGITEGEKLQAQVLYGDRQTVQVRLPGGGELTVRNTTGRTIPPESPVTVEIKSLPDGRFQLETTPQPVSGKALDISILKNYLPVRQSLTQVLTGIREVFLDNAQALPKALNIDPAQLASLQANIRELVTKDVGKLEGEQLKEILDRSGLHYEARVRSFAEQPGAAAKNTLLKSDLKGQLMKLSQQLEQLAGTLPEAGQGDRGIGKLASQISQAISNIELQQLTHHFSRETQQSVALQLPENLLGEDDRFKIFILPDREGGSGAGMDPQTRTISLVFLLNLSALGDLRIETRVFQNDISIVFNGTDPHVIRFIQDRVPELEAPLREKGFTLTVSGRHQAEVDMMAPDTLGELLVDRPLNLVDIST